MKQITKASHQGPDLSFRSEKTSLHEKYSPSKSLADKKQRTGSDDDKREQNGLSLPELRKVDGTFFINLRKFVLWTRINEIFRAC